MAKSATVAEKTTVKLMGEVFVGSACAAGLVDGHRRAGRVDDDGLVGAERAAAPGAASVSVAALPAVSAIVPLSADVDT